MEAGELNGQHLDLVDAMIKSADSSVSDEEVEKIERSACPYLRKLFGHVYGQLHELFEQAISWLYPVTEPSWQRMPTVLLYFRMQPN